MRRPAGPIAAGFAAIRRSKRLLLLTGLLTALVSLPPALYVGREIHALAARRQDSLDLARALDPDFMADLRLANPGFDASLTALVVASFILYVFTRPLVWGGYCGIAATDRRIHFATFLREGGANYWKFLRIAAIGGVLLLGVSLALKPMLTLVEKWAVDESSETLGERYRASGQYVAIGALLLVKLVLDHTKVGVRLHHRPGVLVELGRSAMFALTRLRTFAVFAVARVLEFVAIVAISAAIETADGAYVLTTVIVVILGTLLVAAREAASLFHIAAAWQIRATEDAPPPPPPENLDGEPDILQTPLPWHEP